jgi:hypothetical protein
MGSLSTGCPAEIGEAAESAGSAMRKSMATPTAIVKGERIKANISNAVHAKSLTSSFAFVYGNKPFG